MANYIPYDDGSWKMLTVNAAVAVSGGSLYTAGSETNDLIAGKAYDYTDTPITALASGQNCVGLALYDQASGANAEVALLRKGVVLAVADGTVTAGAKVAAAQNTADGYPVIGPPTAGRNGDDIIGTVLQTATSGQYAYLMLNL